VPPRVAPAIAVERELPIAVAFAEARPPLVAMETAVASPASASGLEPRAIPVRIAINRFMVRLLI
jgi:hypothetical protein